MEQLIHGQTKLLIDFRRVAEGLAFLDTHMQKYHGLKEGNNYRTNKMLINTSSFPSQIKISIYITNDNYNAEAQNITL